MGLHLRHQHGARPAGCPADHVPPQGYRSPQADRFPGLQGYAGQAVDNGPKAKAYADQFIATHLKAVAGGKSYAEVSTAAQANPNDQKVSGQAQSLFRGETLRGLLLYAWGWSVVGRIAFWVAIAAFAGAAVVLVALADGFARPEGASATQELTTATLAA